MNPKNFSFGQILFLTLEIFVTHWKIFLTFYALFFLPFDLLMAIFPVETVNDVQTQNPFQKMHFLEPFISIVGIFSTFFVFAFVRLLTTRKNISFFDVFLECKKNAIGKIKTLGVLLLFSFLAFGLIFSVIAGFLAIDMKFLAFLTGAIGIFFLIFWSQKVVFTLHSAAFRDIFGIHAIWKSIEMTNGKLLKIFSYFIFIIVIGILLSFLVLFFFSILAQILGISPDFLRFFYSIFSHILSFPISLFSALVYIFFEITFGDAEKKFEEK